MRSGKVMALLAAVEAAQRVYLDLWNASFPEYIHAQEVVISLHTQLAEARIEADNKAEQA